MFGGEVVERQQRIAVLDQAIGRSLIFDLVGFDKASNAVTASFLVSAIQISCSARLALVCRLFGILFRMLAVLCTQQRCSRVVGHTSPSAFQNPSAPSATAICGAVVRPRRFKSSSRSRQDCELSRMPSVKPTSSFLPSGVAPMMTRMQKPHAEARRNRKPRMDGPDVRAIGGACTSEEGA